MSKRFKVMLRVVSVSWVEDEVIADNIAEARLLAADTAAHFHDAQRRLNNDPDLEVTVATVERVGFAREFDHEI